MQASLYGSTEKVVFNSRDILYIIKESYECKTYLINGNILSLSKSDKIDILNKLPRVFCYEFYLPVYLNLKEISSYYSKGYYVNLAFRNGMQLKELSVIDFERNVIPKLNREHKREF